MQVTKTQIKEVPSEYIVFLNNIREDEGGELHRNSNESDITTGSGIYRGKHKDAEIFKYVDEVASSLSINTPSSTWSKAEITKVNDKLKINELNYYAYLFYKDYLSGAMLHMFPSDDLISAMGNLYTNTPKGAWSATQYMIKIANDRKLINLPANQISSVDGLPGRKTKIGLDAVGELNKDRLETCRAYLIFGMTLYYIDIATDDMDTSLPGVDKHLRYLKGWTHNRMLNLLSGK